MVTRRKLILSGAAGLLAATLPRAALAAPDDPVGIVTAIYTRAAKGKGDGGGGFVIENKAAKAKYLSKSLAALWAKADARTRKGDGGPIDFDPVTNSQDPDVKSFKVAAEKQEPTRRPSPSRSKATSGSRGQARPTRPSATILSTRPASGRSTTSRAAVDGSPWSVRALLADSLKALGFAVEGPAGHVWGRRALPVITADGWQVPGRSSASPAIAEALPAARRSRRGRRARPGACRRRSSRG